jgi:hypothetical protein
VLVVQPEHLVDDPVVRDAEAERKAALAHRLDRQRLLRQGDRMPRLDRDDGRADLDARRLGPDDRGGRQRVEVVGDLGYPDGGEAGLVRPPRIGAEPIDLYPVAAPFRADHHPDAHPAPLLRQWHEDVPRTSFYQQCNVSLVSREEDAHTRGSGGSRRTL